MPHPTDDRVTAPGFGATVLPSPDGGYVARIAGRFGPDDPCATALRAEHAAIYLADDLWRRLAAAETERDAAVEWIGVVRDELAAIGFPVGDRDVALCNVRALILAVMGDTRTLARQLAQAAQSRAEAAGLLDRPASSDARQQPAPGLSHDD